MYVCMYVCMYILYLCSCVGLHFYECINVWTMLACLCMYTYIGVYACRAVYVGLCIYLPMNVATK
jgi:hypothetical protein